MLQLSSASCPFRGGEWVVSEQCYDRRRRCRCLCLCRSIDIYRNISFTSAGRTIQSSSRQLLFSLLLLHLLLTVASSVSCSSNIQLRNRRLGNLCRPSATNTNVLTCSWRQIYLTISFISSSCVRLVDSFVQISLSVIHHRRIRTTWRPVSLFSIRGNLSSLQFLPVFQCTISQSLWSTNFGTSAQVHRPFARFSINQSIKLFVWENPFFSLSLEIVGCFHSRFDCNETANKVLCV